MARKIEIDGFDRAILKLLQRDNMIALRAIGEVVNLSTAAVQRRVKRMTEAGVITHNMAVVDPVKLGLPITILVNVEVENERLEALDSMMKEYESCPEVQQCFYVTGDVTFVLVVVVPSMDAYRSLTHRLFHDNANVRRFRTYVTLDKVKSGLTIPL